MRNGFHVKSRARQLETTEAAKGNTWDELRSDLNEYVTLCECFHASRIVCNIELKIINISLMAPLQILRRYSL